MAIKSSGAQGGLFSNIVVQTLSNHTRAGCEKVPEKTAKGACSKMAVISALDSEKQKTVVKQGFKNK